jgi:uncharacterized protein (DUF362 family)
VRELSRREFLAVAQAAVRPAQPALAIAHFRSPAAAPEAIAGEARKLTRRAVEALGGMSRFVSRGSVVWVKPNIAWDRRPEQAACTNPDVVAAIVEMCFQAGAKRVTVSDNPCQPAQRTFPRSGIQAAARKAGAQCWPMDERGFRQVAIKGGRALKNWEIYADALEADCLINAGIVKQHSLTGAVLGMKNLMGLAGGARNRFHQDIRNTVADLAGFLRPRLVVLDAVRILAANGPTGGNLADVRRRDTVIAGVDQVAVDAYGATLLGFKPAEIGYVAEAHERRLGNMNYQALSPAVLEV